MHAMKAYHKVDIYKSTFLTLAQVVINSIMFKMNGPHRTSEFTKQYFTCHITVLLERLVKQDPFRVVLKVCAFTYQQS